MVTKVARLPRIADDSLLDTHEKGERPRYAKLIESLTQRLAAKEWTPGMALPSEAALALQYRVAVGTMRKAVDRLVSEHLLVRHHGKGTFVATHDGDRALRHYFRLIGDDGRRDLPQARVVTYEVGSATAAEAERLQIRAGSHVSRFLRVRGFEAVPIISERIVLPGTRFPNIRTRPITDLPPLAYEFYSREYGVIVTEAIEKIRAVAADATEARLLKLAQGTPLLEINRIALDISDAPVEWRVSHCDTRHYYYLNRFN
jgi:GntR family transcriptional regulator